MGLALTVGPAPASASAGQVLLFDNQTAYDPGFTQFGEATGNSVATVETLPDDLGPYACVLLNLNQTLFTSGQVMALSSYLAHGGSVIAIGDWGLFAARADATLNVLVSSLGGHMALKSDFVDLGFRPTTSIDSSPLTAGLSSVQYAGASTISVSSAASSLIRSRNSGAPIAAAEPLGAGELVLLGDSNMISDDSSDAYAAHDNGRLMHNLCSDEPLQVTELAVSAAEGQRFDGTVATVQGDPDSGPSDDTVSIDWGDGSSTSGVIDSTGNVTGSHTYAEEGSYTVATTVTDSDEPSNTASDSSTSTVSDAPLTVGQLSASGGTEGVGGGSAALTFTDANPGATAADLAATVDWGDGTTANGTVIKNPDGSFSISTTGHTYSEEGQPTVRVSVRDSGGAEASASQDVTVGDAALSGVGSGLTSQPSFAGIVASYHDANRNATAADAAATVDWGDGTASNGTVSSDGHGAFNVSGSHTYALTGPYVVSVHVADRGGSTADATSQILVYEFAASDGGSFVIGDGNAAMGSQVDFWGARWTADNTLSSGTPPSSFKGFGATPSTPSCGAGYTATPGSSSTPPLTVPAYMGVFVSSRIGKLGPRVTGNIAHIVVVKTDSGYQPDSGQSTGQVIAQVC